MVWKRVKEAEKGVILGHWENDSPPSMITLTKGIAHIVHRGAAIAVLTPEDAYSSNVATIGKMVAKRIGIADATDSVAFD